MNNRISNFDQTRNNQMVFALRSTWAGLIADLSFRCGDLFVESETVPFPPSLPIDGSWYQIGGKSSEGRFQIFLPSAFLVSMLEAIDQNLNLENLDSVSAGMILEHALSARLVDLENVLGTELSIIEVTDLRRQFNGEVLGLEFAVNGVSYPGGVSFEGELVEKLELIVQQHSSVEEKSVDERMVVHLGPVVLTTRDACIVAQGSTIDCGVMPTEVIKGVLMRSDNRYWPIHIEDDAVEIAGELSPPVDFSQASDTQVFVTFALGQLKLKPFDRNRLKPGDRLQIERYPDNGATVHYQTIPYAHGQIMLLGDNLAVLVSSLENQMQAPVLPAVPEDEKAVANV